MHVVRTSGCKVNLLLNVLGRRPDGYHELESVMQPVAFYDQLEFSRREKGVHLTCSNPALPVDATNLVCRAATAFLRAARINHGVALHLEKRIPRAAGLGGGSGNAAATLLGLNELFDQPLTSVQLDEIAGGLGSDVPFFLQNGPALALGRGETITPLKPFPALRGCHVLLAYPGFGVSTAWAYQRLSDHPASLNGQANRARSLITALAALTLEKACAGFYNSLEAPVLGKYPILALFQEFLRANGAAVALMSGSGSTTFALVENKTKAENLKDKFRTRFGESSWLTVVPL